MPGKLAWDHELNTGTSASTTLRLHHPALAAGQSKTLGLRAVNAKIRNFKTNASGWYWIANAFWWCAG